MRQIILDTETTGLDPASGHRIIEIAAIEVKDRRRTGRTLHHYLYPERPIDPHATAVHGITDDFVKGKPMFAAIANELAEFLEGAELIAHNAPFDVRFLDAEFARVLGPEVKEICTITDTMVMARKLFPGKRMSLNALCDRYQVDRTGRTHHGALLDAELLVDVWLGLTGGQVTLELPAIVEEAAPVAVNEKPRGPLRVVKASDEELAAHDRMLALMPAPIAWPSSASLAAP